jgi:hypothetical protein
MEDGWMAGGSGEKPSRNASYGQAREEQARLSNNLLQAKAMGIHAAQTPDWPRRQFNGEIQIKVMSKWEVCFAWDFPSPIEVVT